MFIKSIFIIVYLIVTLLKINLHLEDELKGTPFFAAVEDDP